MFKATIHTKLNRVFGFGKTEEEAVLEAEEVWTQLGAGSHQGIIVDAVKNGKV